MEFVKCSKTHPKRHRTTLSVTIDPHVLAALKNWMEREGETNISSVVEGFIDCGVRDTCVDCPFYEGTEEEEARERGKPGVGKWAEQ